MHAFDRLHMRMRMEMKRKAFAVRNTWPPCVVLVCLQSHGKNITFTLP